MDSRNTSLQIPSYSDNYVRQGRLTSEDEDGLLYKTYDDYFNMEEEVCYQSFFS